jgi:hypothetical protein
MEGASQSWMSTPNQGRFVDFSECEVVQEVSAYIRENRDVIANTLRQSQDPYARACALVLLREGGTNRDVEKIKQEMDEWS